MVWVKRGAITTVGFLALVALLVTLEWGRADAGEPSRHIVLVVRGMAFYQEGQFDLANPPLKVHAGERVRLVLRNEEIGMRHNFAVPAWGVASRELNGKGVTEIDFVVPRDAGREEYVCAPHLPMMRGTIEIQ